MKEQQGQLLEQQRTYREKGRPALVEALVYLPKGACEA